MPSYINGTDADAVNTINLDAGVAYVTDTNAFAIDIKANTVNTNAGVIDPPGTYAGATDVTIGSNVNVAYL